MRVRGLLLIEKIILNVYIWRRYEKRWYHNSKHFRNKIYQSFIFPER